MNRGVGDAGRRLSLRLYLQDARFHALEGHVEVVIIPADERPRGLLRGGAISYEAERPEPDRLLPGCVIELTVQSGRLDARTDGRRAEVKLGGQLAGAARLLQAQQSTHSRRWRGRLRRRDHERHVGGLARPKLERLQLRRRVPFGDLQDQPAGDLLSDVVRHATGGLAPGALPGRGGFTDLQEKRGAKAQVPGQRERHALLRLVLPDHLEVQVIPEAGPGVQHGHVLGKLQLGRHGLGAVRVQQAGAGQLQVQAVHGSAYRTHTHADGHPGDVLARQAWLRPALSPDREAVRAGGVELCSPERAHRAGIVLPGAAHQADLEVK